MIGIRLFQKHMQPILPINPAKLFARKSYLHTTQQRTGLKKPFSRERKSTRETRLRTPVQHQPNLHHLYEKLIRIFPYTIPVLFATRTSCLDFASLTQAYLSCVMIRTARP